MPEYINDLKYPTPGDIVTHEGVEYVAMPDDELSCNLCPLRNAPCEPLRQMLKGDLHYDGACADVVWVPNTAENMATYWLNKE